MDNGNIEVATDQIAQQQPAAQPTVQDAPDGGAVVTMPDQTVVDSSVAGTSNPDTGTYVEVGNAGGDFGDSGMGAGESVSGNYNEGVGESVSGNYDGFDADASGGSDIGGLGGYDFGNFGGFGGGLRGYELQAESNAYANGGMPGYAMGGGLGSLGGYSDGGRLLKGPGDGVSDSIPAMIGKRQPARLADGEFVVPARIVSELGNGSTEAGARKLYKMMDRIQAARRKTVGKGRVAKNSRAEKHLPA
jgi:hypothetical protein